MTAVCEDFPRNNHQAAVRYNWVIDNACDTWRPVIRLHPAVVILQLPVSWIHQVDKKKDYQSSDCISRVTSFEGEFCI